MCLDDLMEPDLGVLGIGVGTNEPQGETDPIEPVASVRHQADIGAQPTGIRLVVFDQAGALDVVWCEHALGDTDAPAHVAAGFKDRQPFGRANDEVGNVVGTTQIGCLHTVGVLAVTAGDKEVVLGLKRDNRPRLLSHSTGTPQESGCNRAG